MTNLRQFFLGFIAIISLGGISHAGVMVGVDHLEIASSAPQDDGLPNVPDDFAYEHNAQQGCGIVPHNQLSNSVLLWVVFAPMLSVEIPDVVDYVAQAEFSLPLAPVLDGLIRPA